MKDPNLTDRQKQFLTYIVDFHGENDYFPSLREIAAHFEVSIGTVQTHLDSLKRKGALSWDKGKPRALTIKRAEEAGNLHRRSLLDKAMDAGAAMLSDFVQVPILGNVSAGPGMLAEENVEDTLTLPRNFLRYDAGEIFGLKVHGDSMVDAGIFEGDTVLVRMQKQANNGEIVVALLGDEALVKYFKRRDGGIFLESANQAYAPRQVGENFSVVGKVVKLMRHYQ
jgi:repressor LexA